MRAGPPLLLALLSAGCGTYAELGQKLDVGFTIAGGEAWISASPSEARILLLGPPDTAQFAFTSMELPIAAGTAVWATQGTFTGGPADPTLTLHERYLYQMPDERGRPLLERYGATRSDVSANLAFDRQTGPEGQLVLSGDASIAGTYVPLSAALGHLGSASPSDAACAFNIANLAVLSSQVRIIGFGSAAMTQYRRPATFRGTVQGQVGVSVGGGTTVTTDVSYHQFSDFGGVVIDGTQTTRVNAGGNGHMSGIVTLTLSPAAPAPEIQGSVDYGSDGDAVQISSGSASGGNYVITLAGGATTTESPVAAPSPTVMDCLGLAPP
ncbi:MAG TPA: hypothetical protein VFG59_11360 [Anaeromyxobacter sp.]|nr:hypothetical protein [Anaeromyxobacter sp.]